MRNGEQNSVHPPKPNPDVIIYQGIWRSEGVNACSFRANCVMERQAGVSFTQKETINCQLNYVNYTMSHWNEENWTESHHVGRFLLPWRRRIWAFVICRWFLLLRSLARSVWNIDRNAVLHTCANKRLQFPEIKEVQVTSTTGCLGQHTKAEISNFSCFDLLPCISSRAWYLP